MTYTYVFIHGAFCNSAVWAPTARELALRGHWTVAVDLPGHGLGATIPAGCLGAQDLDALATARSGMAGISTADYVAAVSDVVRRTAEHGPVLLVGASRGGLANPHPAAMERSYARNGRRRNGATRNWPHSARAATLVSRC